jgi:hypothetical protein
MNEQQHEDDAVAFCYPVDPLLTPRTGTLLRDTMLKATVAYGPVTYNDRTDASLKTTLMHEWGHGFGLNHHPGCETVMSGVGCENLPVAADASTAIITVYGY